jgi:hypothetical protein
MSKPTPEWLRSLDRWLAIAREETARLKRGQSQVVADGDWAGDILAAVVRLLRALVERSADKGPDAPP